MRNYIHKIIKNIRLYLIILILLLSGITMYQHYILNSIKEEKAAIEANFSSYKIEATDKINQLQNKIYQLNQSYNILKERKEELDKKYAEINETYQILRGEANKTVKTLKEYEREIEKSIKWFKLNSYLNSTFKQIEIETEIDRNCFEIRGDKCYIKTGCLYLINTKKLDLKYKKDIATILEEDKLQSLENFIKNGGGDCEDYALFYKAELNYILEECKDITKKNIIFESYYIDEKSDDRYWLDYDKDWYLNDVTKTSFNSYIYPNIVCGNIYDLNLGEVSGHCVIALTQNKIEKIEDIDKELDGAPLIEPQDGSFIGYVNRLSYGENNYISTVDITDVITDTDYFIYSKEFSWISYSFFRNKIEDQQNKLITLINK